MDRVERPLHTLTGVDGGGLHLPGREESVERAEQEVAGAAGRVDELQPFEPHLLHRRGQRAVEDELLHEHWSLEKGVLLLGEVA